MRRSALIVAVVLAVGARFGSAQDATGSVAVGYKIGPKDLLSIKVFEVPELNVERRVDADGSVDLPLLGKVKLDGLTDTQAAERLKANLEATYVQRASVTVQLQEYRSRPITILGAVKAPGPLAYTGSWTLLEALAAAGGVSDAVGDKISILRRADNGLSDQIWINVEDLLVRADPDANIPIFPNDLINVPSKVSITIYCLGQFRSPGALSFSSTDRITVLTTIARAGGLSDRASSTLTVKRRDRNGKEQVIEVNAKRVLSGKDPDVDLESGDVLIVKESFF
ncbi:MAG TPA: polysaccharide biosynthesis/export family protein [Thermoanaerobaculaceae bacterium]|nr:polysaccharide biosynthesis/export family protein [Thermoanaerobaculaceae bacterium]